MSYMGSTHKAVSSKLVYVWPMRLSIASPFADENRDGVYPIIAHQISSKTTGRVEINTDMVVLLGM